MNRLAPLLLFVSLWPLAALADRREPRLPQRLDAPPAAFELADVKRRPAEPKKLVVTPATVLILNGQRVTMEVWLATRGITLTEIAVADDGVTLTKLVGETPQKK